MDIQEALALTATRLASEIGADAILVLTESGKTFDLIAKNTFAGSMIRRAVGFSRRDIKFVAATPNQETYDRLKKNPYTRVIKLALRAPSRMGQIQRAVWRALREQILWPGELIVCLVGDAGTSGGTDTVFIYRITEPEARTVEVIEGDPIMEAIVELAIELGHECHFLHGAGFMVGDAEAVMKNSSELAPNPFEGHQIFVNNPRDREIIKKFSFLDGAFVIDDTGHVVAACRYLTADASVNIPHGLGTRHQAVAAMTAATKARGVTVSGEDGMIRIFFKGQLVAKIDPKSKMLFDILMDQPASQQ
jgi:DNA integrity scanning protein DisA with diadenylate cyclase activity